MNPSDVMWSTVFADELLPKRCSHCGGEKTVADFYGDCTTPDGRSYWCKACKSAYHREWYIRVGRTQRRALAEFRRWEAERFERVMKKYEEKMAQTAG